MAKRSLADRAFGLLLGLIGFSFTALSLGLAEMAVRQQSMAPWETWGGFVAICALGTAAPFLGIGALVFGLVHAFGKHP